MALVIPLASSAGVIENILFKVRRGIALSRNASQADPTTGVMVDLPEKIDFEMTLIKTHQALTRNSLSESLDLGSENTLSRSLEINTSQKGSSEAKTATTKEIGTEKSNSNGADTERSSAGGRDTESNRIIGVDVETSKSNGTENEANNSEGTEIEVRCTLQEHHAFRQYDKFDTDTGNLEGISGT